MVRVRMKRTEPRRRNRRPSVEIIEPSTSGTADPSNENNNKKLKVTHDTQNNRCCVCLHHVQADDCTSLPCNHVMLCTECIVGYIQHVVSAKRIDFFTCPENDCIAELNYELIAHLVPKDLFEKLDLLLLDPHLENAENIVRCPKTDCQCATYLDEDSPFLATCYKCGYLFCTNCGEDYHGVDTPCNELEDEAMKIEVIQKYLNVTGDEKAALEKRYTRTKLEKLVEEFLNNNCIKSNCKQCPGCKTNIEVGEN
ncbi:E3 ubiquitin-protein ligase RNF14-like protein [Dinothrombium tinctorium]|uniref:RBR-type E3 ubiquitin transferase n=1 Tax=Dinothrombium tinctorium TaxID=1965070 RepID=A0A3S3P643_9ACAR|nr:E3 ubiquitin-protein ligase RNF14-like protein [Dinothrombium tinctorium]